MTTAQLGSFERQARGIGFLVWSSSPARLNGRQVIDTIMLTKDHLQAKYVADYGGQDGNFVAVQIQGCVFCALHAKPWIISDREFGFDSELVSAISSLPPDTVWAAFGDFNEEPTTCSLQILLHEGGATTVALRDSIGWTPTRWNNDRALDYLVTNTPSLFQVQAHWDSKFGDHKVVEFSYFTPVPVQQSWSLPSTVKYAKPDQVSTQQWKLTLAEAWDKRQKQLPRSADTEEQYWWFCSELEAMFRDALRTLQDSQPSVANKRPKGTAAGLQPRQWNYGAHRGGEGQHQERKLRNAAGRLRALLRIPNHHVECRSKIFQRLSRAIGFDPRTDSIPGVLRRVEEQLAQLLSEQSKKRIREWRNRMKTSNVYKWVRQGLCCVPNSVFLIGEPGTASTTVNEALYNLVQHWRRVWDRSPADWQDIQDAFRFPTASAQSWSSPSVTELVASAQAQAGRAAGLDGWSGDEISSVPEAAWQCYTELLEIWFCRARNGETHPFPMDWRVIKQVHIPKTSAAQHRHHAEPYSSKDMRPISVECTLWRVTISSIAHHKGFLEWVDSWRPSNAHGALPKRGVHTAIATLDEAFRSGEALVSQDFSEAFDRADPNICIQALEKAGMAPELTAALKWVWCHQVRWLCLGRYVHPTPQDVQASLPQGDPLSPLALLALLTGPIGQVQQTMRENNHEITMITYVDDRNTVVHSVEAAAQLVESWNFHAPRFGLKENEAKLRVVPRGNASRRREFKRSLMNRLRCPESTVVDSHRVLGVDFAGDTHGEITPVVGNARLDEAERRAHRAALISHNRQSMQKLLATVVSSVAQWGWWLKEPTDQLRRFAQIMRIGLRDKSSTWSKFLRQIFLGHRLDGFFATGFHAWIFLRAAFQNGFRQGWNLRLQTGTWLFRVQRWLETLGWSAVAPYRWSHPDLPDVTWNEDQRDNSKHDHTLRESWRRKCFQSFLVQERRDSRDAAAHAVQYDEIRFKAALAAAREHGLHAAAVLGGGAVSDALYAVQLKQPLPQVCSWCHQDHVPGWDHLCWECDCQVFAQTRPAIPRDYLQRRLAWPQVVDKDYDAAVIKHVVHVRQALLNARYNHSSTAVRAETQQM